MAILTVTLNPALDLETSVDKVVPGEKLLCAEPSCDPGGGGINVARAVIQLGGAATALIAAGGIPGAMGRGAMGRSRQSHGGSGCPRPAVCCRTSRGDRGPNTEQLSYRFIFPSHQWNASSIWTIFRGSGCWRVDRSGGLAGKLVGFVARGGCRPMRWFALVQALTGRGLQM